MAVALFSEREISLHIIVDSVTNQEYFWTISNSESLSKFDKSHHYYFLNKSLSFSEGGNRLTGIYCHQTNSPLTLNIDF